MNRILGPLLVVVGLVLLEWVRLPGFGSQLYDRTGERLVKAGLVGALPLGAVLALAFCPVSAGLFFGGLIPLALEHRSSLWLPALYGLGTGLPVVVFAVLVSAGLAWAGSAFHRTAGRRALGATRHRRRRHRGRPLLHVELHDPGRVVALAGRVPQGGVGAGRGWGGGRGRAGRFSLRTP